MFHKAASQSVSTWCFVVSTDRFVAGETESEYSSVMKQPALPIFPDANAKEWSVVLDAFTVNGVSIPMKSSVKGAPSGKAVAVLDSGSSLLSGPKSAVDAIYKAIPGSYYYKKEAVWIVPCQGTTKVAFHFRYVVS